MIKENRVLNELAHQYGFEICLTEILIEKIKMYLMFSRCD